MSDSATSFGTLVLTAVSLILGVVQDQKQDVQSPVKQAVDVPEDGIAVLQATDGHDVHGVIRLTQTSQGLHLTGQISGLKPGKHGFHIHEYGDLRSHDGKSAGGHFAPQGHKHKSPDAAEHHAGDLGNITANPAGVAEIYILAKDLKLHFVIGRSIVVHQNEDDLQSQPSGDAGPRVTYGVIGFAESSPWK